MSGGRDSRRAGSIESARRKRGRRAAAARAQRARLERTRAAERRHTKGFLTSAVGVARDLARDSGSTVEIERTDTAAGRASRLRWTRAVVSLVPAEVSVQFSVPEKGSSSSGSSIHVRTGRELVRPCPAELLRSGDRRAFRKWLENNLRVALKRSRRHSGEREAA